MTISSGQSVCIDTISHEGLLEDQGRDPRSFFAAAGIAERQVLDDVVDLAASGIAHDPAEVGPHVVTGPIAIRGARAGDVLEVEVLELPQRAPCGPLVILQCSEPAVWHHQPARCPGDPGRTTCRRNTTGCRFKRPYGQPS
jgi:acetamidase/formamidase